MLRVVKLNIRTERILWGGSSKPGWVLGMSGYRFDRVKVLVVDDNAHMRKLVSAILQAFGVLKIYESASGDDAWKVLRESSPDVVVLDWGMEGMSGLDLVQMIRTNPQSPNPVL